MTDASTEFDPRVSLRYVAKCLRVEYDVLTTIVEDLLLKEAKHPDPKITHLDMDFVVQETGIDNKVIDDYFINRTVLYAVSAIFEKTLLNKRGFYLCPVSKRVVLGTFISIGNILDNMMADSQKPTANTEPCISNR